MAHAIIHHKVEDYNSWKVKFDEHSSFRSQSGSKGGIVFQNPNDSNDLFILFDWDSMENLKSFTESDNLKEVMKDAGVIADSAEIFFVVKSAETSA